MLAYLDMLINQRFTMTFLLYGHLDEAVAKYIILECKAYDLYVLGTEIQDIRAEFVYDSDANNCNWHLRI